MKYKPNNATVIATSGNRMHEVTGPAVSPKQALWLRHQETVITIAAMFCCACLAFNGLGNHAFWDDEANTALFGRNLLKFGNLTGWDGQNLIGYKFGAELDENLVNRYMPPVQYYVAAASFALFGESTVGGRILFVIWGLATLPWLTLFARRLGNNLFPSWLPALLLAFSPAWLLYIRNCRYYSIGAFFSLMLLACFVAPLVTRRQQQVTAVLVAVATAGLIGTQYIYAAYILAALPLLLLPKHLRCGSRVVLLLLTGLTSLLIGMIILYYANPFAAKMAMGDDSPRTLKMLKHVWSYLRNMVLYEHVPVLLSLALPLPFLLKRLEQKKTLVSIGVILIIIFCLSAIITVLISPKSPSMRYLVPLIPLGSLFAALTINILWQFFRPLALIASILLVFSNILYLGNLDKRRGLGIPTRGVSSTLLDYISETFNDYETSTETLIRLLKEKPDGSVVFIYPTYMAYPPMFYLPKLRYTCQIDTQKSIRPDLTAMLPQYVYGEKAKLDYAFIIDKNYIVDSGNLNISIDNRKFEFGNYRKETVLTTGAMIDVFPIDRSRPEIGWHSFSLDDYRKVNKKALSILNFGSLLPN